MMGKGTVGIDRKLLRHERDPTRKEKEPECAHFAQLSGSHSFSTSREPF
jgi:hypothetical protein